MRIIYVETGSPLKWQELPGAVHSARVCGEVPDEFLMAGNGVLCFELAWPLGISKTCQPHPVLRAWATPRSSFVPLPLRVKRSPPQACPFTPFLPSFLFPSELLPKLLVLTTSVRWGVPTCVPLLPDHPQLQSVSSFIFQYRASPASPRPPWPLLVCYQEKVSKFGDVALPGKKVTFH